MAQYQIQHELGTGGLVEAEQITEAVIEADPEKFPADQLGFWLIKDSNSIESRIPADQFKANFKLA